MKVSCIITVFNLENFVALALDSILNQTYSDYEIIVVDDCSTDRSAEIISGYVKKYSDKIKYIRMPVNSGVLLAFNEGIRHSTGDLLSFLDGDDIWKKNKLEKVVRLFEKNDQLLMATHDYEYINEEGKVISWNDSSQEQLVSLAIQNQDELLDVLIKKRILCYLGVWLGSAFCLRKKLFDFDAYFKWIGNIKKPQLVYQDHPLATFMVLHGKGQFGYIPEKLFQYRIHSNNYSGGAYIVQNALRAIEKAYETTLATFSLVSEYPELKEAIEIQYFKIQYLKFLKALYSSKVVDTIKYFYLLSKECWNLKQIVKEFVRMSFFLLFGQEFFFKMKKKFSKY